MEPVDEIESERAKIETFPETVTDPEMTRVSKM
jgi:hypothetical protein